ncbi:Hypothetical protein MVR_LOCUS202 [uncultured virus]|nr:Hypothetical protein MVR_LOCUS202 [uncultured virus]
MNNLNGYNKAVELELLMKRVGLVVILIVLVLVVVLAVVYWVDSIRSSVRSYYKLPILKYKDMRHKLQTGDVVLFSRKRFDNDLDKLGYLTINYVTECEYIHVGMVYLDSESKIPYLIEFTYPQPFDKIKFGCHKSSYYDDGGIRIVGLDDALSYYSSVYGAVYEFIHIDQGIDNAVVLKEMNKYRDCVGESKMSLAALYLTRRLWSYDKAVGLIAHVCKDERLTCSEFVYRMLCDCGVVDGTYCRKLYWPEHFDKMLTKSCSRYQSRSKVML